MGLIRKVIKNDRGLSLIELLVALIVGSLVLSVVVMVSFNVYKFFNTTQTNTLANSDNYNLTEVLRQVSQDASSIVTPNGTTDTLQLAMGGVVPTFLPSSAINSTLQITWQNNQLIASNPQSGTIVLYKNQNDAQYTFKVESSSLFELRPLSMPYTPEQPMYFQTGANGSITKSISKNVTGLTLNVSSSQMVPGQTYTLYGTLSTPGASGTVGVANATVKITVSPNWGVGSISATTDANGNYSVSYTLPNNASIGTSLSFTASAAGDTANSSAMVGTFTITSLVATPSQPYAGGQVMITGKVAFNGQTPVSGAKINFSSIGGGEFSSPSVVTGSDGSFSVTYTTPTNQTTATVVATLESSYGGGSAQLPITMLTKILTLTPNSPQKLPGQTVPYIVSGNSQTYTINVSNSQGQPQPNEVINLSDGGAGGKFTALSGGSSIATVTTDSNGNAEFVYQAADNAQGLLTITAQDSVSNLTAKAKLDAGNFVFDNVQLNGQAVTGSNPVTLFTNQNNMSLTGQLVFADGSGIPIGYQTVNFTNNAGGSFTSNSVTTDANGNFSTQYSTSGIPNASGQITIDAPTYMASAKVFINVESVTISLGANPNPAAAGQTVVISGQVLINNQPANNQSVMLSDNGGGSFASSSVSTDSNGNFTVNYTAPSVNTTTDTITATLSADQNISQSTKLSVATPVITVNAVDASDNTVTSVNSGDSVTIQGKVTIGGQPFANQTVTLSDDNAGGTFASPTVTTNTSGTFSTSYTAATPSLPFVEWLGDKNNPTIVINDVNLGSPPVGIPAYNTDGNYVGFSDTTGNWEMGMTNNWVAEDILSWSSNQIVIQPTRQTSDLGIGYGYKGWQGWYTHDGWYFNQGDKVNISIATANGSITIESTVNYQSDNSSGQATITATSDGVSASTDLTINMGTSVVVPQSTPQITSVGWDFSEGDRPLITISGSNFGSESFKHSWWWRWFNQNDIGTVIISDTNKSGNWEMGGTYDLVKDHIHSWKDNKIILTPSWSYGDSWFGNYTFNPGDSYTVTLITSNGLSATYSSTIPTSQSIGSDYDNDNDNDSGSHYDNGKANGGVDNGKG